jgi:hypothetical protein
VLGLIIISALIYHFKQHYFQGKEISVIFRATLLFFEHTGLTFLAILQVGDTKTIPYSIEVI